MNTAGQHLVPAGRLLLPGWARTTGLFAVCQLLQEPLASRYCLGSLGVNFGLPVTGILPGGSMAVTVPGITVVKACSHPKRNCHQHAWQGVHLSSCTMPPHAAHLGCRTHICAVHGLPPAALYQHNRCCCIVRSICCASQQLPQCDSATELRLVSLAVCCPVRCRSHAGLERVLDGLLTAFKILTPFLVNSGLALHPLSTQHMQLAAHMAESATDQHRVVHLEN